MAQYDERRPLQFLSFIEELTPLHVRPFDAEALTGASQILRKFGDQRLTLADAHGLMILKTDRATACWSTDRHLGLTGSKLVC